MTRSISRDIVCATLACALALPVAAAELPKLSAGGPYPKICLVLSGGGARGAAHVGVIKVLEELRVPIHCITGTSMGSLVGGSYATGTSVAEMDQIMADITSELLFKEKPPRRDLTFRNKQDDYKPYFGPEFGAGEDKFSFGLGLVSGVQLEVVLRHLSKAKGYQYFDKLPIPYRAVATNLVTGKAVVFNEGEIANVMRASMSVPGAVAPADVNGMMLVDGMLTQNLPVDAARAMGADIIIAVNVGTPLLKREQLNGILGVSSQMLSILTEQNVQASIASLKSTDILISPQLGDFSTGDFDHLPDIVPLGEAAARTMSEQLARLSIPPAQYAALRKAQQLVLVADNRPLHEIRFEKLEHVNPKSLLAVMETKVGDPVIQQQLDTDMRNIYGTGDFEHVNYKFLNDSGQRVLAVEALEKSWGPDYLRFGLGLYSDLSGDSTYNLLVSYKKTWLNSLGGEWKTDVQIGNTKQLHSEFYQPLVANSRFFIVPSVNLENQKFNLYQGNNRIAVFDKSSYLGLLEAGMNYERFGELRIGLVGGIVKPNLEIGSPALGLGQSRVDTGAFTARIILDQLDSVDFPREGWRVRANAYDSKSELGADTEFTKVDGEVTVAQSFGEHTFNLYWRAGDKVGSKPLPTYAQFQLGGFLNLSGYSAGQFTGGNFQYGRFMYYRRILKGGILDGVYGGFSLEAGKVGNSLVPGNSEATQKSASVFTGADTPLGPVYFGYGHSDQGNNSIYFVLGRIFQ